MTTVDLRSTVKEYANTADTKLLTMIIALAESYHSLQQNDTFLNDEQYALIDERRELHRKNESKSFTWEQVKENARKAV
jgi:hypothetical protein